MPTVTVTLPPHLKAFLDSEVNAKKCSSSSEYIGLLVQKAHLESNRTQVEKLLLEGVDSGPATPMTRQDWQDIRRRIGERLEREKSRRRPKRAEPHDH